MTLYHYHGGTGTQRIGDVDDYRRFTSSYVTYSDDFNTVIDGIYDFDSGAENVTVNYYYGNDILTGLQAQSASTNTYVTGDFPFSWSGLNQASATLTELAFDSLMYSTDDIVDGSSEGGSLKAWTHAADDQIRLHTGTENYVDAGVGNDYIQNWSWYAKGVYSGGTGNDLFSVASGDIYGDSGADTFQIVPIYIDVNGINGPSEGDYGHYAKVKDFEIGVDSVVGSGLPIETYIGQDGIWLNAQGAKWSMLVEGVFDVAMLNLSIS